MGHIRSLEEDLGAVGLDRDFEPRYSFLKDKSKAIQQIKECAKVAKQVYLASDDDREGEAISYSVAILLGLPVETTPRIVFHEITEIAITTAIQNPKRINMNRAFAQQARAILDMMVGFTISPLLWKFVGPGLSAGRCQTPALRLVKDREQDIVGFKAETSWAVEGSWLSGEGGTFEAQLTDRLEDEESASNYLENIHDNPNGKVISAETVPTSLGAPKPLITSTLQQEASGLYGYQPKSTMRSAQHLYEKGYITYMRTDNPVLCEDARLKAEAYVRVTYGEAYIQAIPTKELQGKKKVAKTGTAQEAQTCLEGKSLLRTRTTCVSEAHEAIRPTDLAKMDLPLDEDWSAIDRKIYKLIWSRTIQSVMAQCRGEERRIEFVATGDPNEFVWKALWSRILFQGWKKVAQAIANLDEEEVQTSQGAWTLGQTLEVGSVVQWTKLEALPKETKAQGRYTEATLVRELERRGIGRPSTFATLVGTIIDKNYVEKRDIPAKDVKIKQLLLNSVGQWPPTVIESTKKIGAEKQKLSPTPLGSSALEFCVREFDELFAYGFTKEMEQRLDRVAEGTEMWKDICRDTWSSFKDKYASLKEKKGSQIQSIKQMLFSNGIKAVQSKKGPILLIEDLSGNKDATVFYGWPEGKSFSEMTEELALKYVEAQKVAKEVQTLGEYEGEPMICKTGPYGKYVVCGKTNTPWKDGDTADTIRDRIKVSRESVLHMLGPYEFRRGPYGVYMFKKDVTKKQFVGLPAGVDPKSLTVEAAIKIYQTGLQTKAKAKSYNKSAEAKKNVK
jgi:DNA topoisomerase-1